MSKFKYQARSEETVSKRIADRGGDYDNFLRVDMIKVKEGDNVFRIMPPTWDTKSLWGDNWCIDVWLHWDVGPDKASYLCFDKMAEVDDNCPKGDCPVCAMLADLDDEDLVKRMKPKRSLLAYVIDRNNQKEGPQVWRLGKQLEGNLQFRSKNPKTGAVLPIDHPDRGYDILFRRVGTDEKTKYINEDVDRDESPLHDDIKKQDKWLDQISDAPLPTLLNYYTPDYIAKVLKGKKSKKASDDDDKPTRTTRGRRDEAEEEADPRDRRRGRDIEDEDTSSRRRSSRDEEADTSSRRRSRDADEEDTGRSRSRGRDADEEDDSRSSRRGRRDEAEEEDPDKRDRPRAGRDEDEEEAPPPRRRSSRDEEPEKEEKQARRRPVEDDDEIPSKGKSRAPAKDEDEGEEEPEEDVTSKAKQSLKRLQPKGK